MEPINIEGKRTVDAFCKAGNFGTWRIPDWMLAQKPHLVNANAEALRYTCQNCGVQEPYPARNGFVRRECGCAYAARQRAQLKTLISETKTLVAQDRVSRTYTWLGDERAAAGLEFKTFKGFVPHQHRDALSKATWYAAQLCNGQYPGNIIFAGSVGTGKTHLAAAILNRLRTHQPEPIACLFATAQGFFSALYAAEFEQQKEIIEQAAETPLLVIDDLDKLHIGMRDNREEEGEYQRKVLFDLLNRRYLSRLPTIITTNEQRDLSRWLDPATLSRLNENLTILAMNGADYRSGGKQ